MSDTPETREAWDAVSRTPDGMYDSRVPIIAYSQAMSEHSKKMERQRNASQAIIREALNALPVGYIPAHTPESLPARVADLVTLYADAERQSDAYAETLRQTLVLLDGTANIESPVTLANILRERHPELADGRTGEGGES